MLKKQKYVTAVFCLFLSFFFAAMGILQYQMIRGKKLPERMERSMNQQKELLKQAIILWQ